MSISGNRTLGLITFDNINSRLGSTLNVDTNGSGTTAQTLTLHSGVTLANTTTTVAFRGSNGPLSVVLGANNLFTTSAGSYLQFNSGVIISGGFGVTIAGAGNTGLNAPNTFTGGITVQNGATLRLGASAQNLAAGSSVVGGVLLNGQAGTGTLALQNGSTLISGGSGSRTMQNNLTLDGSITLGASSIYTGALTFNSNSGTGAGETLSTAATISLLSNTTLNTLVTSSLFNAMSGAFSLTKQGSANLRISAVNSYSGGTTVAAGTLEFGRTGSLGSGTVTLGSSGGGNASLLNYLGGWTLANDVIVASGSGGTLTLGYTSGVDFSARFTGSITLNDDLTLLSTSAAGFAMRLEGPIIGSHDLTKTGTGTVRIENNNPNFTGSTTISDGTLQIGNAGTTGSLGAGNILNNAALRINRSNAFTLTNTVSGTGSLTQAGTGITTLTGTNSYTGTTTVSAGTLLINGNQSLATGNVSVTAGATLGGTGIVGGATTILGTHRPGTSAGLQTFLDDLTYDAGSSFQWELFSNTDSVSARGTSLGWDGVNVGGDLAFLNPVSLSLVFNDTGSTVNWTDALWSSNRQWLVWSQTGLGTTSGLGNLFISTQDWLDSAGNGFNTSLAGSYFDVFQSGQDVYLRFNLVPEPSRAVLLLAGALGLGARRRRRIERRG